MTVFAHEIEKRSTCKHFSRRQPLYRNPLVLSLLLCVWPKNEGLTFLEAGSLQYSPLGNTNWQDTCTIQVYIILTQNTRPKRYGAARDKCIHAENSLGDAVGPMVNANIDLMLLSSRRICCSRLVRVSSS
jgi:hypothetical protein